MIDLRSDTVTVPDDRMREAARTAAVGDDVYGEDPTVTALEETAADRLGTEAALFFPSGTMANQVAARVHAEAGQEVIADRESHVVRYELGGLAQHAGLQVRMVDTDRGVPDPETIQAAYVEADAHRPGTGLCCLENTHNARGGLAIDPDAIAAAAAAAHDHDVPVHLDGARLFNAAVARGEPATAFTRPVDSVMVSLSKGLGAPVGSLLAGEASFIEAARRTRKLFGGAMRQVGIVAGPGLVALENVESLERDHRHASHLADGLSALKSLTVEPPETNIVLATLETMDSSDALAALENEGVLATAFGPRTLRLCTHRDLDRSDVDAAIAAAETAL